jgi:hypothetical protein
MNIKNKVPFSDIKIKKYKSLNDLEKLQEDKNITSINDIESQVEIGISNTNNKEKYIVTQDNTTYFVSCKANINMKIIWTLIFILIIILIITVSNQ